MSTAQMKFFQWARKNQPEFYADVKLRHEAENDEALGFDWGSMFNTAISAYGQHRADKLKKRELRINLERARQGQDPVDFRNLPQQPGAVYTQGSIPTDFNKIALYGLGAVAIVGVLFYMSKRGRK